MLNDSIVTTWDLYVRRPNPDLSPSAQAKIRQCHPISAENGTLKVAAPSQELPWLTARFTRIILNWMRPHDIREVRFVPQDETAEEAPDAYPEEEPGITASTAEQDAALTEFYRLAYNKIVRPNQVIHMPAYWLRWLPAIKASGLSLILGLRQTYYLKARVTGEMVSTSLSEIGRWAGLTPGAIKRALKKPPFASITKGRERRGFVLRFPAEPWVLPEDARRMFIYLFAVNAPVQETLMSFADELATHPDFVFENVLGNPSGKSREGKKLWTWFQEWGVAVSVNDREITERIEALLFNHLGDIYVPWYLLKYREGVGHLLFWAYIWRQRFAPQEITSYRSLGAMMGIPHKSLIAAERQADPVLFKTLFSNGLLGPLPPMLPLLPADKPRAKMLAERMANEREEQEQKSLPVAWAWDMFSLAPDVREGISRQLTPAQFVTLLAEGYANEKVRRPVGLAVQRILNGDQQALSVTSAPPPQEVYNYLVRAYHGGGDYLPSPWNGISPKRAQEMAQNVLQMQMQL